MGDVLVRGGTVVDGTGAPATDADVRVRDGVIVEVGPDLAPDGGADHRRHRRVRDPRHHRHPHPPRRRDVVEPRPRPAAGIGQHVVRVRQLRELDRPARRSHSATRSSTCSASSRTCRSRRSARRSRGHGKTGPSTWPRWRASRRRCTSAGYVGHLALRTFVMGHRGMGACRDRTKRWRGWPRCSTSALAAGAIGLSSINHFDKDRTLRPVPGYLAADAEYRALFGVVARHHPATAQIITLFTDPEHEPRATPSASPGLSQDAGVRLPVAGLPDERPRRRASPAFWQTCSTTCRPTGVDFWPVGAVQAAGPVLRLRTLDRVPACPGVERRAQRSPDD